MGAKPTKPTDPVSVVESVKEKVKELKFKLDEALRAHVEHLPWIGFEVTESGFVKSVTADSAAAEAGVQDGDRCLKVGSVAISSLEDFRAAVRGNVHPGMTVPFTLQRGEASDVIIAELLVRCVSMKTSDHGGLQKTYNFAGSLRTSGSPKSAAQGQRPRSFTAKGADEKDRPKIMALPGTTTPVPKATGISTKFTFSTERQRDADMQAEYANLTAPAPVAPPKKR